MSTYARYPVELAAGEGCWLIDSAGRRYLDFTAGIAVNVLGHGHRAVVEAIRDASAGLLHVSNLYWTEPMIRLAERLAAAARMEKVFFCNSGAEAVEAALKLARRARPGRSRLVCFERSFHGRTLGALTVTAQHRYQEPFRPLLPDVVTLPFGDFEAPDEVVDESVSAVIVEPVQGEGGMRPAPAGWLAHLRSACDRAGALLIFDEVQAGIGRTGTFFACEQDGVLPDILVAAKALAAGLPMGATLARGSVAGAFQPGDHGSTFGGGPLVAAVANAVLDEVLRDGFLAEVESKGEVLRAALGRLADRSPRVAAVRGRGLMLGLVLASESAGDLVEAARGRGLLLCPAGADVVRLVPPLIVLEAELEEGVAMLEAAVGDLGDEKG
jgi:predicted acetylornithine/succinylornithine family transaminase